MVSSRKACECMHVVPPVSGFVWETCVFSVGGVLPCSSREQGEMCCGRCHLPNVVEWNEFRGFIQHVLMLLYWSRASVVSLLQAIK